MGLITRDASTKSTRGAVTIIAEGNCFTGEMNVVGKMHIDGGFEGEISSSDAISIGVRGEVKGVIKAHRINVCGLLEGEIHCDELMIEDGGRVRGMVYSDELIIEKKGCFVGERNLKEKSAVQDTKGAKEEQAERVRTLDPSLQDLPSRVTLIDKSAAN